ncbi:DUF4089 domain-containing protein [Variovorax ureilyticus]|uniref:DUF4089 domain-containing protein n=1 Tax=Variovorax ureilyticus TaxID=1836198 RepID=A0ABU8VQ12_9BURK
MTPVQIETYVDAAAAALGLRLRPDHRPGVLRYFALAADLAAVIDAVPLAPHHEPAVAFSPVVPKEKEQ